MAFLEKRNGKFRIKFSFEGQRYSRSLRTDCPQKASLAKSEFKRNLELVSLGLLKLPDQCNVVDFFLTGEGKSPSENLQSVRLPECM